VKTLETARLRLRPRTLDDLEAIMTMDSDPDVRRYFTSRFDPIAHRAEVRANIVNGARRGEWRWAIEWLDRPGLLGQCGVRPSHLPDVSELSWRLVQLAWGQGIATEACTTMITHLREKVCVGPLAALIHPDNTASQAVARKLGLKPAGETVAWNARQLIYRLD